MNVCYRNECVCMVDGGGGRGEAGGPEMPEILSSAVAHFRKSAVDRARLW